MFADDRHINSSNGPSRASKVIAPWKNSTVSPSQEYVARYRSIGIQHNNSEEKRYSMHMFGGFSGMGFGGGAGMLFMILFWGIIIALVITLIRRTIVQSYPKKVESPHEIVKNRYAKGELSRDEYLSLTRDLS